MTQETQRADEGGRKSTAKEGEGGRSRQSQAKREERHRHINIHTSRVHTTQDGGVKGWVDGRDDEHQPAWAPYAGKRRKPAQLDTLTREGRVHPRTYTRVIGRKRILASWNTGE